ncbi:nucleotidyltransferase domain-containing protein [Eubacteriaceae bacterium ES3]|nr:nucleotidyltransferase domain-containing protein [Eubacteriaceae bacterium ES3]
MKSEYTPLEISRKTKRIFSENDVRRAFLFGSYAKGSETAKSDIDIYAEFFHKKPFFELCGILYDLREALKKDVDFFDEDELKKNPDLYQNAKSEGICIYEKK